MPFSLEDDFRISAVTFDEHGQRLGIRTLKDFDRSIRRARDQLGVRFTPLPRPSQFTKDFKN